MFQCLLIDGENSGEDAQREAERFVVTDEQFQEFVDRHGSVDCLVPESNTAMRYSYLILDEYVSYYVFNFCVVLACFCSVCMIYWVYVVFIIMSIGGCKCSFGALSV